MPTFLNVLTGLAAFGSSAVIIVLLLYLCNNTSGHTSFEPWLLSVVFVPTLIMGIIALFFKLTRPNGMLAWRIAIIGLGILFLLDYFNLLVQYDRWVQRGMP